MSTEDAIEREVQRRVSRVLSAAGLPQGQLNLEVLYMLPPEFVRAYTRLFDRALLESVKQPKLPDAGTPKKIKSEVKGTMPTPGAGGKRFRTHWVIRDEAAFKNKGSIDRKLRRLTGDIERVLGATVVHEYLCSRCSTDLTAARDVLPQGMRFCPSCGSDLRGKRNHD